MGMYRLLKRDLGFLSPKFSVIIDKIICILSLGWTRILLIVFALIYLTAILQLLVPSMMILFKFNISSLNTLTCMLSSLILIFIRILFALLSIIYLKTCVGIFNLSGINIILAAWNSRQREMRLLESKEALVLYMILSLLIFLITTIIFFAMIKQINLKWWSTIKSKEGHLIVLTRRKDNFIYHLRVYFGH